MCHETRKQQLLTSVDKVFGEFNNIFKSSVKTSSKMEIVTLVAGSDNDYNHKKYFILRSNKPFKLYFLLDCFVFSLACLVPCQEFFILNYHRSNKFKKFGHLSFYRLFLVYNLWSHLQSLCSTRSYPHFIHLHDGSCAEGKQYLIFYFVIS